MRLLNRFTSMLKIVTIVLLTCPIAYAQLTVTKTYTAPGAISIDGCGVYCASLPAVTFSAADFTNGYCQITDVDVSITWLKTDGTCSVPAAGNPFHNETSFRIDGPAGNNVILLQPNGFTGSGPISTVTTVLDQSAATLFGGIDPVSGTFRPYNGNLNTFNGTSAFGNWFLRAGDLGGGDPLCIYSYSVTITVSSDNIAPVPTLASLIDINAACSVTSLTAPTATDNCSGTITGTHNATLPITAQGTTVVTWTYTDGSGNNSTQTQNVIINDVTPPAITLIGSSNVNTCLGVSYSDAGATAMDNCGGNLTGSIMTVNPVNVNVPGTYTITYNVADAAGNPAVQVTRTVQVYGYETIANGDYASPSSWLGGCVPPNPIPPGVTVLVNHNLTNDNSLTNNGVINAGSNTFTNNGSYKGTGTMIGNFINNGSVEPGNQ